MNRHCVRGNCLVYLRSLPVPSWEIVGAKLVQVTIRRKLLSRFLLLEKLEYLRLVFTNNDLAPVPVNNLMRLSQHRNARVR